MESNCSMCMLLLLLAISTSQANNGRPFLDVYLRMEPVDDFCGALHCNISYAISVLTNTHNKFDLHSLMLQDGHMTRRTLNEGVEKYFFEENTVVRLSEELLRAREKIYLGVMFFDVPADIQDYLVIEVTDVIRLGRSAKTEFSSDTLVKIGIQVYRRNEATSSPNESNETLTHTMWKPYHQRNHPHHHRHLNSGELMGVYEKEKACTCAEKNCGCCEHVTVRKIHLDDDGVFGPWTAIQAIANCTCSVCVNITYISADIGVRLALLVDNHVYYSKELSLRNPPPACFEVPHLREYASICVRLYNLELKEKDLTGCTEIEAILLHLRVARHRIGCFRIPII